MHFRTLMVLSGFGLFAAGVDASQPTPKLPGVFEKREITFVPMGFTTTYTCRGLADKLKVLLRVSGAREDIDVVPLGCGEPGTPSSFAQAQATFYVLVPGNEKAPKVGAWRQVRVTSRSPRELAIGDCELVERYAKTVLPLFSVRNVQNRTRCLPHQHSGSFIDLRFEVFAQAPKDPEKRP